MSIRWPMVSFLAILHSVTFALAFPPYNLWPLIFVSIAPLAIIGARTRTPRKHAVLVLAITFMQWLWMCRWSIEVTAAGYPGYALIMALYAPLFVLIAWKITRERSMFARVPLAIVVPIVWGGLEFFRGRIAFDGYPWFLIAHPTVEWTVFPQIASVVGGYGVGMILAIFNGALADVILRARLSVGARIGVVATALATFGLSIVIGMMERPVSEAEPVDLNILAIQTNLPQDNKIGWPVAQQEQDIPGFIEQTRRAIADARKQGIERIDLIVWPETMVPGAGLEPETRDLITQFGPAYAHLYRWGDLVRDFASEAGIPMLVGSPAWVGASIINEDGLITMDTGREYNSAYLVAPTGEDLQRYDKVFLTPFGETMPYISKSPWLEQKLLALGAGGMQFNLDAADGPRLLTLQTLGGPAYIATPICFEDTVPWLLGSMVRSCADPARLVLINLSNDGWFGRYDEGRQQHAQIARFRCIEHRVPMVRVVNTGLSVHVDSRGNLVDQVGDGRYGEARQTGWMIARVRFDGRTTLYTRLGDVPGWAAFGLMIVMLAVSWYSARKHAAPSNDEAGKA